MAGLSARGDSDGSVESMMTYGALNDVIGIEAYHDLWDRFANQ